MAIDKNVMEYQIKRLQSNLLSIRKIAGWTAQDLGDRIGVTKQTISNLETKKTKLTQTQYIAIRAVLDYEVQANKENIVLLQVINILLNNNEEEFDEKKDKQIINAIETVAATAAGGIVGAQLATVAGAVLLPLVGPVGVIGGTLLGSTLGWLNPFMKNKKKRK